MGLDMATLEHQKQEKRAAIEQEAADERAHAQAALLYDQAAMAVEQARVQDQRQRTLDLKAFNLKNMRMDMRREYHLSDPKALKHELPARVSEDDPRCGPSGMQKFDGEILEKDKTVNKKAYQMQQREWLLDQMAEKEAKRKAEMEQTMQDDHQILMATQVRGVIENHGNQAARDMKVAHADFNKQLAAMQSQQRSEALARNQDAVQRHRTNLATSDRYTERLDAPVGLDGRVIRDEYKRISADAEQEVYDANALQIIEKRQRQKAEEMEAAEDAARTLQSTMVLTAVEQEQKRLEAERNRQMGAENAIIAQAQRNMRQHQRNTYANTVTDDFFRSFNAGAR
jgi:hypothetical protein